MDEFVLNGNCFCSGRFAKQKSGKQSCNCEWGGEECLACNHRRTSIFHWREQQRLTSSWKAASMLGRYRAFNYVMVMNDLMPQRDDMILKLLMSIYYLELIVVDCSLSMKIWRSRTANAECLSIWNQHGWMNGEVLHWICPWSGFH